MNEYEAAFLASITSKLPKDLVKTLIELIETTEREHDECFATSLFSALVSLNPSEYWLLMELDCKGVEELTWQANAMAQTHGIKPEFRLEDEETAEEGLEAFNDWLSLKQFVFLQFKSLCDTYYGFICRKNQSSRIVDLAKKANIVLEPIPARPKINREFIYARKKRSEGKLGDIFTEVVDRANAKGYRAIMYLAIPDCEPCMAFERFLNHPLLNQALKGTSIFRIDAMLWGNQLARHGLRINAVPAFIGLTRKGEVSQVQSSIEELWKENTPQQIAAFFRVFLSSENFDLPQKLTWEERQKTFLPAVYVGDLAYVRQLIEEGVQCDQLILSGENILGVATAKENQEMMSLLLGNCSLINSNTDYLKHPLFDAMRNKNEWAATQLILKGANVKLKGAGVCGITCLHQLAQTDGDAFSGEFFNLLLKEGAKINARDGTGATPLHLAASFGRSWTHLFLSNGADPNLQDNTGNTPLHRAANVVYRDKGLSFINMCLEYGGDLDKENLKGETVRQIIIKKHGTEALNLLAASSLDSGKYSIPMQDDD